VIIMIGIPGAGKTTFAQKFSDTFQAPFINQGAIQESLYGARYAKADETARVQELSLQFLHEVLKTKQTVVYEDCNGTRRFRHELAHIANKAGYVPLFVWVQTESAEALRRVTRKNGTVVPMTSEQFDHELRQFSVPVVSEHAVVISGKHTYASQLKNVLRNLAGERAHTPLRIPRRNNMIQ